MEIRVWRASCCTPEASGCTGCSRRLHGTPRKWTNRGQDRTEGRTQQKEGELAGKKQPSCTQRGKDSRSGERRKKEGRKKEKGADEAGKSSTELYQSFDYQTSVFLG